MKLFLRRFLIVIFLFGFNCSVHGQFLDTLVSSFHKPPKFFFTIDLAKSFGANNGTDIYGFKLGVVQNNRIYYGLGYYIYNTDVYNDKIVQKENGNDTLVPAQLRLRFFTVNAEYIFYRDDHWQFGVPANIGNGKSYFQYYKAAGEKAKTENSGSMLFTLGVSGQYKFIPWIGLGFGVGRATTLGTGNYNDSDFKAWVYNFGIKIFFNEIYHTLRDLNKSTDKKKKPADPDDGPQPDLKN